MRKISSETSIDGSGPMDNRNHMIRKLGRNGVSNIQPNSYNHHSLEEKAYISSLSTSPINNYKSLHIINVLLKNLKQNTLVTIIMIDIPQSRK